MFNTVAFGRITFNKAPIDVTNIRFLAEAVSASDIRAVYVAALGLNLQGSSSNTYEFNTDWSFGLLASGTSDVEIDVESRKFKHFKLEAISAAEALANLRADFVFSISGAGSTEAVVDIGKYLMKEFEFTGELSAGSVLVVDHDRMTALLDGSNALQYIKGDFLSLFEEGILTYVDTEASREINIQTKFKDRWL